MWRTARLILPILIPSWRFFRTVEASPRIEWARLANSKDQTGAWREYRPRAPRLSPLVAIRRLFWNPAWNEALYLVTCAERVAERRDPHSIEEIRRRILRDIAPGGDDEAGEWVRFRLVFLHGGADGVEAEDVFLSPAYPINRDAEA